MLQRILPQLGLRKVPLWSIALHTKAAQFEAVSDRVVHESILQQLHVCILRSVYAEDFKLRVYS